MPNEFWIGATVPGRKAKFNPWTHSGRPAWNTYQGLGMKSCVKEINQGASAIVRERRKGMDLHGRRSRVHVGRPLDHRNVCHRAKELPDRARGHFERARVLSLQLDRAEEGTKEHLVLMKEYVGRIKSLLELDNVGRAYLTDLIQKERSRGRFRAFRVYTNLKS